MTRAGWYRDPQNPSRLRWWNGVSWTAQTTELAPDDARAAGAGQGPVFHLRVEHEELEGAAASSDTEMGAALALGHAASGMPALEDIEDARVALVNGGQAVRCAPGKLSRCSAAELARVAANLGRLALVAYDSEADTIIRTLRPHTAEAAIARLDALRASISRLGASMELAITDEYHALRVREVQLTADYLAELAEQREREREASSRLEDEEREFRQLEAERQHLVTERAHFESVAAALRAKGDGVLAAEAEHHVAKLDRTLDEVAGRLAKLRAGYVYVLSNIGAFGDCVVKIGLTRRPDPHARVLEFGGDSVPFQFDIHALVFSHDAVSLVSALHQELADHRVNLVDDRCEFFAITPEDARLALSKLHGDVVTFVERPEAAEWRQSESERRRRRGPIRPPVGVSTDAGWSPTRLRGEPSWRR